VIAPRREFRSVKRRADPLRPIAWVAAALVAVGIAALLVAPELIDWNRYRDEIALGIEQRLGRAVSIDGPLTMSLLPAPHLAAERLRVVNLPGAADPDFAVVQRLELELRVLPLLAGRLEVSSLILIGPQIHLQRLADGRANWRFANAGGGRPPGSGGTLVLGGMDENALLDRVELRNARVTFRHPRLGAIAVEGIEAEASADSADGPFQFDAKGTVAGMPLETNGSLGHLGGAETPVDLALGVGAGAARLGIGGVLTGRDAATSFNGRLSVKAAHAEALAAAFGIARGPTGPLDLRAGLAATRHEAEAKNLTIDLAGAQIAGSAAVELEGDPQFDVKLSAPHIDLDAWLAPAKTSPAAPAAPAAGTGQQAAPFAFAPPPWLGASLDLNAESVVWRGAIVRGARLSAQLTNGEVTINQVGATLPGDTMVNLFGFIDAVDGKPAFDGSFETGTDNLRSLLGWLKVDVDAVPADRLGAARFTGHIVAAPDRIRLDSAELRVDGTRVNTAVDLRLAGRPALGASFAIDTFNADAYRPRAAAVSATAAAGTAGSSALARAAPLSGTVGKWLGAFDANLKGHVEQLVAGGVTLRGLDLDGALTDGSLVLRSLAVADLDGARATLAGGIDDLGGAPRLEGMRMEAHSDDPRRLLGALGINAPEGGLGALALTAELSGGADELALQSHAEIAGLVANVAGRIATPLAAPAVDVAIEATHSSLAGALRLLGLHYGRRAANESVSAAFHLTGDGSELALDDLRFALGPLAATGHASFALGPRPRIDAALTAGEVPLDALLGAVAATQAAAVAPAPSAPRPQPAPPGEPAAPQAAPLAPVQMGAIPDRFSRAPIELGWMDAWDGTLALDAASLAWGATRMAQSSLALTLAQGKLALDHLTGQLWGGDFSATAALGSDGVATLKATLAKAQLGQATLGAADLDLAEGTFDADADLATAGNSPAELIGRLGGVMHVAALDGVLKGFDLAAVDERLKKPSAASLISLAQAGFKGGQTKFSSLAGTLKAANGFVTTDDLKLVAEGGTMEASGAINLPAYAMDARALLHLADAPDAPPLVMHLSGPLDAPRRVLDINPLQNWLAQRAAAKRGDAQGN